MGEKAKKFVVLLLILSLIASCAACNQSGDTDLNELKPVQIDRYYNYTPEFSEVFAAGTGLSLLAVLNDALLVSYQAEDKASVGIATVQKDGSEFTAIWRGIAATEISNESFYDRFQDVVSAVTRADGSILLIMYQHGVYDSADGNFDESFMGTYLLQMSPDGTIEREIDLVKLLDLTKFQMHTVTRIQTLHDDSVLIGTVDALYVLTPDFSLSKQFELDINTFDFTVAANGEVFVNFWNVDAMQTQVFPFDLETGAVKTDGSSLFNAERVRFIPGTAVDLHVTTDEAVYSIDLETKQISRLFGWDNADMPFDVSMLSSDTGELFLLEFVFEPGATPSRTSLIRMTS